MQAQDKDKYHPERLLDALIEQLNLKNDAGLARVLGVSAPTMSKVRNGRLPLGPSMLVRMHEESGLSVKQLRALMGDARDTAFIGRRPAKVRRKHWR
jgi:plasmid maintenance system antidote protein VapI